MPTSLQARARQGSNWPRRLQRAAWPSTRFWCAAQAAGSPPAKPADAKPEAAKPEAAKPGDKTDDKAAGQATPSGDPDEPPKEQAADYQLLRAADLIRGISLYGSKAN